jgi:F-box-like
MDSARTLDLFDLPNEVLVSTLTPFPTSELLPLVTVCRRFHSIILRILHFRLLLAASLPEYKLILEAYHPSRRWNDPYYFCTYLGTDGLSSKHEGEGSLYADCATESGRLAKLGMLYSRFRPERPAAAGQMPLRRIAGAAPVHGPSGNPNQPIYSNVGD